MKTHSDLNDLEFEKQFRAGSLNPALFNHEAHLRLAWMHITKYGVKAACNTIVDQILDYITKLNETEKLNKTLTIAAVKTVNHFVQKSKSDTFQDFITEFPRLKNNFKELIGSHYGFDIFNSERAKKEYLEPDVLPF